MRTSITLILLVSLFAVSCGSEESPLDCGCNSPTVNTIPNEKLDNIPIEVQKMGVIFFKDDKTLDRFVPDERWDNRFWISQFDGYRTLIICNEDFLSNEFDFLKEKNIRDSIKVSFSGNLKSGCSEPFATPTMYSYYEIELISIEKMN
jgi:hypothetical protein